MESTDKGSDPLSGSLDGSFVNRRGQRLSTQAWLPPKDVKVRGIVARHHGLGDYKHRTSPGNTWFAQHGFIVWSFDAHGHGDSEPHQPWLRCAIRNFDHIVDDAAQFLAEVVMPFADEQKVNGRRLPVFLLGASMGALSALHVVAKGRAPGLDGLIVSAAAIHAKRTLLLRILEPISGFLNMLIPLAPIVPVLQPERLCRSPELIEEVNADTELYKGSVRICTACAVRDGMAALPSIITNIKLPVLMLHGTHDLVCSADSAKVALDIMPAKEKTWVPIDGAWHDLEFDYDKELWHAQVLEWLQGRTPP